MPWFLYFVLLALPISLQLSAAEHPSFTGTWKLDKANSDFGALAAPDDIVDIIDQRSAELFIQRNRDGRKMEVHIPLDGSEKQNTLLGVDLKTTAHWDGDVLVVASAGTARGNSVSYQERWTVSPDGNTFKVARHLQSPRGETEQTVVMQKQAGATP